MKLLALIPPLLFNVISLYSQTMAKLDSVYGFKGIRLNSPITMFEGKLSSKQIFAKDNLTMYTYKSDDPEDSKVFDVTMDSIRLYFHNDTHNLAWIQLTKFYPEEANDAHLTKAFADSKVFLTGFFSLYGKGKSLPPDANEGRMGGIVWAGDKVMLDVRLTKMTKVKTHMGKKSGMINMVSFLRAEYVGESLMRK